MCPSTNTVTSTISSSGAGFCSTWRACVEGRVLGVRTSRVLLGVLNNRSRDPPRVDVSGMCACDFVHRIFSFWNFCHWICTESCVDLQCRESSTEPSLCTCFEGTSTGLTGRVLNVRFMESSIDDVTSFLDPRRALRFFASGFCHPPYLGVPNVSASASVTEVCDPSRVEAIDHQSYLTGNQSRLPT